MGGRLIHEFDLYTSKYGKLSSQTWEQFYCICQEKLVEKPQDLMDIFSIPQSNVH